MTERQAEILTAIREHVDTRGFSPTLRELCAATGVSSVSVIDHHLRKMANAGHIIRRPDISRGLTLPDVAAVRVGDEIEATDLDGRPIGRVLFAAPVPKAA